MDLAAPGLENAFIRLEPLCEAHREPLRATDITRHMWESMPAIQRGAGFDAYFDHMLRCRRDNEAVPFVVFDKQTEQLIGVTAYLDPVRTHRRVMIGYTWVDPSRRRRGLFRMIQGLLIKRAILWGARRVGWQVEARNKLAVQAIEALGARHEGTLRNYARFADGTWIDLCLLSLLRDEAKDVVLKLEAEQATLTPNEA
jgi:RimJ/RimL family protein N-acetyltransferase